MEELLFTYIKLFGSISAISTAFLMLLYQTIKSKVNYSKANLIDEVRIGIGCTALHKEIKLKDRFQKYSILKESIFYQKVDIENTKELNSWYNNELNRLENSAADQIASLTAQQKLEAREHIKMKHKNSLEKALSVYNKTESYYGSFWLIVLLTLA